MRRAVPALSILLAVSACTGRSESPVVTPAPPAAAALERPIPYPPTVPAEYLRALERGTRTTSGAPGARYWQQWSEYRIDARVDPAAKAVEGTVGIRYHNNSPDSLGALHVDLTQNFHAEGALRLEPAEVTGGVTVGRVAVNGRELRQGQSGPRWLTFGTRLVIVPERRVAPGGTADIAIDWSFTIPESGIGGRMGWNDDNFVYLAYWYPQMAVYDDVVGWHTDMFLGPAEFYAGFGRYDVTIEAPEGWVVMGTGALENAEEVLAAHVLERLRRAERSDTVVHVIEPADFGRATQRTPGGWLGWQFRADTVRDVAYAIMRESRWDAARTRVGDRDGDGTTDYARVDAFWRTSAPRWRHAWRYAQHSIDFLARFLDFPYPWPHMTAVEGGGIIGGGMEYPMMTLIGAYNQASDSALYSVTAHELAHMWVPMIVSVDERRYAWMDEGTTSFNENAAEAEFYPGFDAFDEDLQQYLAVARAGAEGEIMRLSNYHYTPVAYGTASYPKPSTLLYTLRSLLGEETFQRALRAFIDRWAYRHPYPWDLFNTFEDVAGRDLDWFWRSWYYETWTLDQAVASVTPTSGGTRIVIEDRGLVPMPVRLTITQEGGATVQREIPVETWLGGARTASVTVQGAAVTRVEIDAVRGFPDVDRANNVWIR